MTDLDALVARLRGGPFLTHEATDRNMQAAADAISSLRAALARAEAENAALLAALVAMVETYQYEASSENESLLQARAALARAVDERKG